MCVCAPCADERLVYVAENGDCVQPAREPRCSPGGGAPLGAETGAGAGAPCELLFLPLVTPASLPALQLHDRLLCRHDVAGTYGLTSRPAADVHVVNVMDVPVLAADTGADLACDFLAPAGFAATPCPQLRPMSQVSHLRCDPTSSTNKYAKRCDTTQSIRTRCPFMQTCDHVSVPVPARRQGDDDEDEDRDEAAARASQAPGGGRPPAASLWCPLGGLPSAASPCSVLDLRGHMSSWGYESAKSAAVAAGRPAGWHCCE